MSDPKREKFARIPEALRTRPQWVGWKRDTRNDKPTKVPYDPKTARLASTVDPRTWGTYDEACAAFDAGGYDGIGFVFTKHDPFVGIDLDKCRDPETGVIAPWAAKIVKALPTYWEVSPSGTGLHAIAEGTLPPGRRRQAGIEMYETARYFCMSGQHLEGTAEDVAEIPLELHALHAEVFGGAEEASGASRRHDRTVSRTGTRPEPGSPPAAPAEAQRGGGNQLVLDDEAKAPRKFRALYANHPKFALTYGRKRTDFADQSPSAYDLSLASFTVQAGWTDQDIVNLLIQSRRTHGDDLKLRRDYYERTLAKAHASSQREQNQEAARRLLDAAKATGNPATALDAAATLARLPASEYAKIKVELKAVLGKKLNSNDLDRAVNQARRAARDEPATDGLPRIEVSDRPLRDMADDALRVLTAANTPPEVFVRSGALARVRADEQGRPIIETITETHLRGRLTRLANFLCTGKQGSRHVSPPDDVVRNVLARGSWALPALEGVVEVPTMRPDGTICDTPGYDAATRLIYQPASGLSVPPVPASPTDEAIRAARALLHETIGEFPYVDAASYANLLGLLLTPVIRPAIAGKVPLALLDKPKAGTGASLLAEVVTLIATGRPAAMMGAPDDNEEWRKAITATLISGATTILIDNVAHPLESPHLSRALTAPDWKDRVLGLSKTVTLPQRATWMATGNNIRVGGDVARRCYWIRLDAHHPRPWKRDVTDFTHPQLIEWASVHRGDLLAALLTLARAWFVAGRPMSDAPVIGGFDEWARITGGVLARAEVEGFLGNTDRFYDEADEEATQYEAFLTAWVGVFHEAPVTVAELCEHLPPRDTRSKALWEALPDDLAELAEARSTSFRRRLGKALAKRTDTPYGEAGLRLERAERDSHHKVARWRVRGMRGMRDVPTLPRVENPPTFRGVKGGGITEEEGGEEAQQTPHTPQAAGGEARRR